MNATTRHRNDGLIRRTRAVWEPRLGRHLSCAEAEQIAGNASSFFAVLTEWSQADSAPPAHDAAIGPLSDTTADRHER